MTFRQWMRLVDLALLARVSLTHHDLADFGFRDAFEDGISPEEVAAEMLDAEGFVSEDE